MIRLPVPGSQFPVSGSRFLIGFKIQHFSNNQPFMFRNRELRNL